MTDTWADQYEDARRYRTWPSEEVIRFIAGLPPTPEPRRALDLGCGAGGNLWALLKMGFEAYGVDPSPAARAVAREVVAERLGLEPATVPVYHGTAEAIPFPDAFFHVLIEVTTVQHVTDQFVRLAVVQECARVLRPGGRLLSVHLLEGTDYTSVFKGAPPVSLAPTVGALGETWRGDGTVAIERMITTERTMGMLTTRYGIIHATKL